MALDEARHRGQADAAAGKFVDAVEALEGVKQFLGVFRPEAGAVASLLPGRLSGRRRAYPSTETSRWNSIYPSLWK